MKKYLWVLLLVAVVAALLISGCSSPSAPTTSAPGTSTAPASTTAPTTSAASQGTLKVGFISDFSNPLGIDYKKLLDALMPVYNNNGGLNIGGQKYNVQFIEYDSKNDAPTGTAAINRLIFQDGVKFILGDTTDDAWIPITEANKVVTVNYTPTPALLSPKYHYSFQGSQLNSQAVDSWVWFAKNYPNLKTVSGMWADNAPGHGDTASLTKLYQTIGLTLEDPIYYPPTTTDFTAYATKIKNLNPDVYTCAAGGPVQDALGIKAVRGAGYAGQIFLYRGIYPGQFAKIAPLSLLDGSIGTIQDYTLDTPTLAVSKEAKDAYVAKYGSWDNPVFDFTSGWYLLKAGLEKAGSIDPDKVAAAMSSGLTTDTPNGTAMLISRPDQGNTNTVDTIFSMAFGKGQNGQITVTNSIDVQQVFDLIKQSGVYGTYK